MKNILYRASVRLLALCTSAAMCCAFARAEWSAKASATWTSCYVKADCPGTPACEASDVNILSGCFETCTVGGDGCAASATAEGNIAWRVKGFGLAVGGGAFGKAQISPTSAITLEGTRPAPARFVLAGTSNLGDGGKGEVAVFKFFGDPNVFEGVEAKSVLDLVQLGFIDSGDVLLRRTDADVPSNFQFEVDVSGLADENIVVFAAGDGQSLAVRAPVYGFPTAVRGGGSFTEVTFLHNSTELDQAQATAVLWSQGGEVLDARSVVLTPNSASSVTFDGGELPEAGHIQAITDRDISATAILNLSIPGVGDVPPIGVGPSSACQSPVVALKRNSSFDTGVALSNPATEPARCGWSIYSGAEGAPIGNGVTSVPARGQTQSFPLRDLPVPPDRPFEGSILYECDKLVHPFSLFQRASDGAIFSNAVGCPLLPLLAFNGGCSRTGTDNLFDEPPGGDPATATVSVFNTRPDPGDCTITVKLLNEGGAVLASCTAEPFSSCKVGPQNGVDRVILNCAGAQSTCAAEATIEWQ